MTCGHANPDHHKYCSTCGEQLNKAFCSCGSANELHSHYCGMCGQNLSLLTEPLLTKTSKKIRLKDVLHGEGLLIPAGGGSTRSMSQQDIEQYFSK